MRATGHFVEADGVRLHYLEAGSGPPLVLLHGNGAVAADFEISGLLAQAAGQGWRVVAFDRPGSGFSDRPRRRIWTPRAQAALLAGACAQLGIGRAIVLGHSWGALPALHLALDHSGMVAGLALLSGFYFPHFRSDVALFSPFALPLFGDAVRFTIGPSIARRLAPGVIRRVFAPSEPPERFLREFPLDLVLRPSQLRAIAEDTAFMLPATAALSRRYTHLTVPVAILTGDADRIVKPARHSLALHRAIPRSRLDVLPGQGHMIHYFAGDAIMTAVAGLT